MIGIYENEVDFPFTLRKRSEYLRYGSSAVSEVVRDIGQGLGNVRGQIEGVNFLAIARDTSQASPTERSELERYAWSECGQYACEGGLLPIGHLGIPNKQACCARARARGDGSSHMPSLHEQCTRVYSPLARTVNTIGRLELPLRRQC